MKLHSNYYFTSFFWTTVSKILNAVLSFLSIPVLMAHYGKEQYGVLSIAIACNACMYVLDMGLNVGAVKFYAQWRAEGDLKRIERVARTNISFYLLVSLVNVLLLMAIALFGTQYFAISEQQVELLTTFMLVLAGLSVMNWLGNVFYQLLVANEQLGYAMKVQTLQAVLKICLLLSIAWVDMSITTYFFLFTLLVAMALVPYALRCRRDAMLLNFKPALYLSDFKVVFGFSLSIFALSLLQIVSVQSRPLLLGMFAENGATMVADYRIVELIPNFLIVLCGMYASIFLPKISAMMSHADMQAVQDYANVWTLRTSVLACMIGGAIFLCAPELMYAYLGSEEDTLAYWLAVWIPAIILQIHTTPGNAIVLAHGRTMPLILTTLVACMLSIPVNVVCLERFGVGAAVVSYYVYILIVVVLLYVYYYDHVVRIKGCEIFQRFFLPTVGAMVSLLLCNLLFELFHPWMGFHNRWESVGLIVVKTATWVAVYFFVLKSFKIRNAFKILREE